MNRKTKLSISLILSLVFTVLTLVSIRFVITDGLSVGYAVVPALFSICFTAYCKKLKKHK